VQPPFFSPGNAQGEKPEEEDLAPEQLARLIEAIEPDANVQAANFMKLALSTGMRQNELFRLQWRGLDFESAFIHIRYPKGGQDQRIP
jgi:integrase